ncbi:MAG: hypothetical protein LBU90_10605 [Bacteroidales bacterium]|jgi:hypothetical protein|nr:hypothetical protein [Bacteroidales bacterium]
MKIFKFATLCAAVVSMSLFASCDKKNDDDSTKKQPETETPTGPENPETPIGPDFVGSYTGTTSYGSTSEAHSSYLTKTADGTYSLNVAAFSVKPMAMAPTIAMPDFTITGITIDDEGTLTGGVFPTVTVTVTTNAGNVTEVEAVASLKTGADAAISNGKLEYTIHIAYTMPLDYTFSGTKL